MPQNSTRSPRILLLLAYLYVGLGVFIVGVCLLPVQHQGMVNPSADLDPTNFFELSTIARQHMHNRIIKHTILPTPTYEHYSHSGGACACVCGGVCCLVTRT